MTSFTSRTYFSKGQSRVLGRRLAAFLAAAFQRQTAEPPKTSTTSPYQTAAMPRTFEGGRRGRRVAGIRGRGAAQGPSTVSSSFSFSSTAAAADPRSRRRSQQAQAAGGRGTAARTIDDLLVDSDSDIDSDNDSDNDSNEEFPALPSTTRRVTIVEDNNEVQHFVKGSAPADLKKDLVEQADWSKFPDTLTTHERQKIHDELREKRTELAELQQANSGSWADAGDEEDIEEEIAELEARLLLASGYTLRA